MLLYAVVIIFHAPGVTDTIFHDTALMSEAKCDKVAAYMVESAKVLSRKKHLIVVAEASCLVAGVAI